MKQPLNFGSAMPRPGISVCVCTYRRPVLLARLLSSFDGLDLNGIDAELLIVDNAPDRSAESVATCWRASTKWQSVRYCCEPKTGISFARNRACLEARGDWIAFIDDDEVVCPEWLSSLIRTATATCANAVFGPVRPQFPMDSAPWAVSGGVYDRPEHAEGQLISVNEARTGNVLIQRIWLVGSQPFDPDFGLTGGEDFDFFKRMHAAGGVLRWSSAAVVYEWIPAERQHLSWLIQRSHSSATLYWRQVRREQGFRMAIVRAFAGAVATCLLAPLGFFLWPFRKLFAVRIWLLAAKCWARVAALGDIQPKRYGQ